MSVVNLDRGMREGESPSRCSRGISYVKPIGTAKVAVPVRALAENLCEGGLRRVGKELVGRCPLPDHQDRTPSFAVNPDKNL